jgi:hypothetical protein
VTSDGGPEDQGNSRNLHDHGGGKGDRREAADDEPVLPRTTSDEHPEAWGDRARDDDPDDLDRFLRERPPHHGD